MKPRGVDVGEEQASSGNRLHSVAVTALVGFVGWLVVVAIAVALGAVPRVLSLVNR